MRQTLGQYIGSVNLAMADLTNGELDLDNMTDYAEGEASLSEMHDEGLAPRDAARRIMFAEGYQDALNCWSNECDECEHEWDCPHIS